MLSTSRSNVAYKSYGPEDLATIREIFMEYAPQGMMFSSQTPKSISKELEKTLEKECNLRKRRLELMLRSGIEHRHEVDKTACLLDTQWARCINEVLGKEYETKARDIEYILDESSEEAIGMGMDSVHSFPSFTLFSDTILRHLLGIPSCVGSLVFCYIKEKYGYLQGKTNGSWSLFPESQAGSYKRVIMLDAILHSCSISQWPLFMNSFKCCDEIDWNEESEMCGDRMDEMMSYREYITKLVEKDTLFTNTRDGRSVSVCQSASISFAMFAAFFNDMMMGRTCVDVIQSIINLPIHCKILKRTQVDCRECERQLKLFIHFVFASHGGMATVFRDRKKGKYATKFLSTKLNRCIGNMGGMHMLYRSLMQLDRSKTASEHGIFLFSLDDFKTFSDLFGLRRQYDTSNILHTLLKYPPNEMLIMGVEECLLPQSIGFHLDEAERHLKGRVGFVEAVILFLNVLDKTSDSSITFWNGVITLSGRLDTDFHLFLEFHMQVKETSNEPYIVVKASRQQCMNEWSMLIDLVSSRMAERKRGRYCSCIQLKRLAYDKQLCEMIIDAFIDPYAYKELQRLPIESIDVM